ncbi:hypothetical protein BDA99DRAFT_484709 [Phascolomyces articulosus]|uniref:Polysaccharide lyase 14 domain-containing protein n=1 Tax=Phascolomyces articulosus TaxID=60185 RepID=A0AAD5JWL9_9FUNG|nr:hypothetical protein BDA99DRAFT_484709 [Phascolomyces articulosus]
MMYALSDRASSLNLKKSFNAIMPCSVRSGTNASMKFIKDSWGVFNGYFYGKHDVSFVDDPIDQKSGDKVLRVFYEKGSFSPAATRRQEGDVSGGTEFYVRPFNDSSFKRGLISYDVAFDGGFDWVKGGKLPGLYGGEPTSGCTGGKQSDGSRCFSVRMMWRSDGYGEAYAYLPPVDDVICKNTKVKCNEEYGISLARGAIDFAKKSWTRIEIYTEMNDPGQNNGELHVWQDGRTVIDLKGMVFRNQNSFAISSILFSTFFGGASEEYATPSNTYTFFKNIQFSVADKEELDPIMSTSTVLSHPSFSTLWLFTLMTAILVTPLTCQLSGFIFKY